VHHLDLLVDEGVGDLDGRVLHRVVDDPVGETVARPVERVAAEPLPDVRAQRREIREVAERGGKLVVGDRQDLLAQLPERSRAGR
jgi:hypothetical protein